VRTPNGQLRCTAAFAKSAAYRSGIKIAYSKSSVAAIFDEFAD
jgi:hypothetical protein